MALLTADSSSSGTITRALRSWNGGKAEALDDVLTLVYEELRGMARKLYLGERHEAVLQPTALVHEVYLRMVDIRQPNWTNRAHFFAAAATIMRRILMDEARKRVTSKRAAPRIRVDLSEAELAPDESTASFLILNDAIDALEALDPPLARLAELRFLAGLTNEETAAVMEQSVATVKRNWSAARAFLLHRLSH